MTSLTACKNNEVPAAAVRPELALAVETPLPDNSSLVLPTNQPAPRQGATLGTRIAYGSLWSLVGQVLPLLASLLATPLVIRWLGTEAYGVLTLINLLIGYLAFSDLGMGTASTRFGAEAFARADEQGEAEVVWTALVLSLIPALCLAGLLIVLAEPLLQHALRLPVHLQPAAILTLRLAALGFIGRCLAAVLNTPQLVRLRIQLNATITATIGVGQIGLVPVVLWFGGGLVGAGVVLAATGALLALSHAACSLRLLPRLRRPTFNRALWRPLVSFGGALVLSQLAGLLLANGEKLVLTRVASVKVLAYYSVAYTLASLLTMAPTALGQSLLPAFTGLLAQHDQAALLQLYQRALRAILLLAPPVVLVMVTVAQPFITLWAGPEFGRESIWPFYLLLGGLIVNVLAYVPLNLLIAAGQTHLLARYYWLELLPYLVATAWLAGRFGAVGAALAWSLRTVVDAVLYLRAGHRILTVAVPPLAQVGKLYWPALGFLLLPVIVLKAVNVGFVWQVLASGVALIGFTWFVQSFLLRQPEQQWLSRQWQRLIEKW